MAVPAEQPRWRVQRPGLIAGALVLCTALAAWALMLSRPMMTMPGMSGAMSAMNEPMSAGAVTDRLPPLWSWSSGLAFAGAWTLMMAAMMLPSATAMIALFSTVTKRRGNANASLATVAFAAPYALLWAATVVPVYAAAVGIAALGRHYAWVRDGKPYLVAGVLVVAGLYQFTPLKRICLSRCRSPLTFVIEHWRPGVGGAIRMGWLHAIYCLGCCSLLMVVLVAAGSMGIAWVLTIAAVVALEKLAPPRLKTAAVAGLALIALGTIVAIDPHVATELRA